VRPRRPTRHRPPTRPAIRLMFVSRKLSSLSRQSVLQPSDQWPTFDVGSQKSYVFTQWTLHGNTQTRNLSIIATWMRWWRRRMICTVCYTACQWVAVLWFRFTELYSPKVSEEQHGSSRSMSSIYQSKSRMRLVHNTNFFHFISIYLSIKQELEHKTYKYKWWTTY